MQGQSRRAFWADVSFHLYGVLLRSLQMPTKSREYDLSYSSIRFTVARAFIQNNYIHRLARKLTFQQESNLLLVSDVSRVI